MKFKMRRKPTRPERTSLQDALYLDYSWKSKTLEDLIDCLKEKMEARGLQFDPSKVELVTESHYDYDTVALVFAYPEEESKFLKRLEKYKVELKRYNQWAKDNKHEIAQHLARRERAKISKQQERLSRLRELHKQTLDEIKKLEAESDVEPS